MRSLWPSLNERLVHSTETHSFHPRFKALRGSSDVLRPFAGPRALLERLHARDGKDEEKNRILGALVAAAQAGGGAGEAASTLLWLALWPGLDAIHRRLSRFYASAPEDLVSEITGRFTANIHRLNLNSVHRIAASLVRNVERDIRSSLQAYWADEARRSDEAMDEIASAPGTGFLLALPDGVDVDVATGLLTERLRAWIGDDADIVVAIAIHGESSHEVAARLGIDAEAVRKRYRRALRRLEKKIEINF